MGKKGHFVIVVDRRPGCCVRPRRRAPMGRYSFHVAHLDVRFLLTGVWRKGIHLDAVAPRHVAGPADVDMIKQWSRPVMGIKKRDAAASPQAHRADVASNLFTQHMALVEHMALTQYDDKSPREPGWITIKTNGAAWVVQVKDPDSATSFTAIGDTLDKALDTANLLLSCEEAPWEHDTWLAKTRTKSKK